MHWGVTPIGTISPKVRKLGGGSNVRASEPRPQLRRSTVTTAAIIAALIAPPAAVLAVLGDGSNPVYDALPVTLPDPEPRRPYRVIAPESIVSFPGDVVLDQRGIPELFVYTDNLPPAEFTVIDEAGAGRAHAVATRDAGLHRAVWRYTMRDGTNPARLRDAFERYFHRNSWRVRRPGTGEVAIWRAPDGSDALSSIIGYYIRGRDVIRVEARGKDAANVERAFAALLTKQRSRFPPKRWSSHDD